MKSNRYSLAEPAYDGKGLNSPRRFLIFQNRSLPFLFDTLSWFLLTVILSFSGFAAATETSYPASTQSNSLDNTNNSARSAAMGSAFTGVADDASALFSNPAGLAFLGQGQLILNSDLWLLGTFQESLLLGIATAHLGGFGLAAQYLNYGLFDGRDSLGSLTSSYSADRLDLNVGWGLEILRNLSVGLGLNGSQSTLAGVGYRGLTSNLGVLWRNGRGIRLGISYVNGGWVSPAGTSESAVNLGASYQTDLDPHNHLLFAAGGTIEPAAVNYLQAGVEYEFQKQLFLRTGYQQPLSESGIGGLTGLTAGVGFRLAGLDLDYAYLPYGDLGASHRISLGFSFETFKSEAPRPKSNLHKGGTSEPGRLLAKPSPVNGNQNMGSPIPAQTMPGSSLIPPLPGPDTRGTVNPTLSSGLGNQTTQPSASNPSGSKDSLVVQFEDPSDSGPDGAELEKEGKYPEAQSAYADAIKRNPQEVSNWWALGNLYRRFNQKPAAIQCFEQVIKLEPNNQKMADWLENYKNSQP